MKNLNRKIFNNDESLTFDYIFQQDKAINIGVRVSYVQPADKSKLRSTEPKVPDFTINCSFG
jgi:hypothetical protein